MNKNLLRMKVQMRNSWTVGVAAAVTLVTASLSAANQGRNQRGQRCEVKSNGFTLSSNFYFNFPSWLRNPNTENTNQVSLNPCAWRPPGSSPESGLVFREEDSGWSAALQSGRQEEEQLLRGRRAEPTPLPPPGAHAAPNPPPSNPQIR